MYGDEMKCKTVPWGSKNSPRHGTVGFAGGSGEQVRAFGLITHKWCAWKKRYCGLTGTSPHPDTP